MTFPELASKITAILTAEFPEIQIAIVFGSRASDTATSKSDVDLAVASLSALSPDRKVDLINRVSSELGSEVDLLDLNAATGTVFKEAIGGGRLVLNKTPLLLARILSRLFVEEADFQKLRRSLMAKRRKAIFDVS